MEKETLEVLQDIRKELQDIRSILERGKEFDIHLDSKVIAEAIHDSVQADQEQ